MVQDTAAETPQAALRPVNQSPACGNARMKKKTCMNAGKQEEGVQEDLRYWTLNCSFDFYVGTRDWFDLYY